MLLDHRLAVVYVDCSVNVIILISNNIITDNGH